MLCSQMAGDTGRSDWVGGPWRRLHSPSGTSAWMPVPARDAWASLLVQLLHAASWSSLPARRSSTQTFALAADFSQGEFPKSTRRATRLTMTQLLKPCCVPLATFHWLPRDGSDSPGRW